MAKNIIVDTDIAEVKQVWKKTATANPSGPWADSLLRVLTAIINTSTSEELVLELTPEEYREWVKYGGGLQW